MNSPSNSPLGGRANDRADPFTPFPLALYAWRNGKDRMEITSG